MSSIFSLPPCGKNPLPDNLKVELMTPPYPPRGGT